MASRTNGERGDLARGSALDRLVLHHREKTDLALRRSARALRAAPAVRRLCGLTACTPVVVLVMPYFPIENHLMLVAGKALLPRRGVLFGSPLAKIDRAGLRGPGATRFILLAT